MARSAKKEAKGKRTASGKKHLFKAGHRPKLTAAGRSSLRRSTLRYWAKRRRKDGVKRHHVYKASAPKPHTMPKAILEKRLNRLKSIYAKRSKGKDEAYNAWQKVNPKDKAAVAKFKSKYKKIPLGLDLLQDRMEFLLTEINIPRRK